MKLGNEPYVVHLGALSNVPPDIPIHLPSISIYFLFLFD